MNDRRQRSTGPTKPTEVDYIVLVCKGCDSATRYDVTPHLVGGAQLRRWFSDNAQPCKECGNLEWIIKAHFVGTPDLQIFGNG